MKSHYNASYDEFQSLSNFYSLLAIITVDKDGLLDTKYISKNFKSDYNNAELKYVAKLISVRYSIAGFEKIMDGLEMTINVFKTYYLIVTPYNDNLVGVILNRKKSTNLIGIEKLLQEIRKWKL